MHQVAVNVSLPSLLLILLLCHPGSAMPVLRHRIRHQPSAVESHSVATPKHDGYVITPTTEATNLTEKEPWSRIYIPWQSVPLPDVDRSVKGTSNVHSVWERIWGKEGDKSSKDQDHIKGQMPRANLTILPLCTLLVMLVFMCVKVSRWWHDDIREADDKMLLFHMPGSMQWAQAHKPRLPQRRGSSRRRGGSRRNNSVKSVDMRRPRRVIPSSAGECDGYSPRDIRRLQRQGSKTSANSPRLQKGALRTIPWNQRHPPKRVGGRRNGEKRGGRSRGGKSGKSIEEGLAMIAMPFELHFSHFLRQQHEQESASISSPSSLGRSSSTMLSDSVSLSHLRRSDSERSRNTSYDSGAVANSSQSSSQTDVASFTDTTTTGFSSEGVNSPKHLASPVGKPYRGKDLPLAEFYAKHLALWRHQRQYYGEKAVVTSQSPSDDHMDVVTEPIIVAPALAHPSKTPSVEHRRRKLGLAGLHPVTVIPAHIMSPYGTPADMDVIQDLWTQQSPRSSSSSGTEATVRFSPTKSGRSSLQDSEPGLQRSKSTDSISSTSTSGHLYAQRPSAHTYRHGREARLLSVIPSPAVSMMSLTMAPGGVARRANCQLCRSLSGNLKLRYGTHQLTEGCHLTSACGDISQSVSSTPQNRNNLVRHTWCFGDKSCVISDKRVIKLAAQELGQTTSV